MPAKMNENMDVALNTMVTPTTKEKVMALAYMNGLRRQSDEVRKILELHFREREANFTDVEKETYENILSNMAIEVTLKDLIKEDFDAISE